MEKRSQMKKTIRITGSIVAGILVLSSVSCQDLSIFVDHLDDEVKLANDRYLEVEETFPEQNDQNLSPQIDLLVLLDREINPEALRDFILIEQRDIDGTVTEFGESSVLTETMNLEFSKADRTLRIIPHPFWAGGQKITVSLLPGAMAIDGSVLRDIFSWSFYTVKVPNGVIEIADGANAQPGYTNTATPDVDLFFSNSGEYVISSDLSALETAIFIDDNAPWVKTSVKTGEVTVASPVLAEGNNKYVYAYFKDPSTNTISSDYSDSIYVDLHNPTVDAGASPGIPINTVFSRTGTASDGESGIYSYQWASSPAGLSFGSPIAAGTTISGPSSTDEDYTVTFKVTDKSGRSTTDSFVLDWDNQAPTAPVFTTIPPPTSTTDNTPTWVWANPSSPSPDAVSGFTYRLDSGSWSSVSSTTTYTSPALPDGKHYLYVGKYDNAGNLGYITNSFVINMADISPYDNQSNVSVRFGTTLNWPSGPKFSTYKYIIYTGTYPKVPIFTSTGSTSEVKRYGLSTNTTYHWRYGVTTAGSTTYYGPFDFTTSRF